MGDRHQAYGGPGRFQFILWPLLQLLPLPLPLLQQPCSLTLDSFCTSVSSYMRPIKRLVAYTVLEELVTACGRQQQHKRTARSTATERSAQKWRRQIYESDPSQTEHSTAHVRCAVRSPGAPCAAPASDDDGELLSQARRSSRAHLPLGGQPH